MVPTPPSGDAGAKGKKDADEEGKSDLGTVVQDPVHDPEDPPKLRR